MDSENDFDAKEQELMQIWKKEVSRVHGFNPKILMLIVFVFVCIWAGRYLPSPGNFIFAVVVTVGAWWALITLAEQGKDRIRELEDWYSEESEKLDEKRRAFLAAKNETDEP